MGYYTTYKASIIFKKNGKTIVKGLNLDFDNVSIELNKTKGIFIVSYEYKYGKSGFGFLPMLILDIIKSNPGFDIEGEIFFSFNIEDHSHQFFKLKMPRLIISKSKIYQAIEYDKTINFDGKKLAIAEQITEKMLK